MAFTFDAPAEIPVNREFRNAVLDVLSTYEATVQWEQGDSTIAGDPSVATIMAALQITWDEVRAYRPPDPPLVVPGVRGFPGPHMSIDE